MKKCLTKIKAQGLVVESSEIPATHLKIPDFKPNSHKALRVVQEVDSVQLLPVQDSDRNHSKVFLEGKVMPPLQDLVGLEED